MAPNGKLSLNQEIHLLVSDCGWKKTDNSCFLSSLHPSYGQLAKKGCNEEREGGEREGRELIKETRWGGEGGCTFYERVNSEIQSSPKCSNV